MYKIELQDFILEHDNWEELLVADPYNLKISRDNGYIMFKYNQIFSDFSIPLVREARGIIFEESTWECVCRAFDKFGNYGEGYVSDLDWDNGVSVQEKVDGSLIKIWNHNHKWHISTNGNIDAFNTNTSDLIYPTFGLLFERALKEYNYDNFEDFCKTLDPLLTYMFELATEKNRVVIPYEGYHIYFLGARDMPTMREVNIRHWFDDVELPKLYDMSTLEDVTKAASELPWDEEGYVVVDKNFNRCKIKSPKYVIAHFARNNNVITTKRLIQIVLSNEIEEFCIYCEDYKDKIHDIADKIEHIKGLTTFEATKYKNVTSKKELSKQIKYLPGYIQGFVFMNFDQDISWEYYTRNWSLDKWERIIEEV